ncbi:hypothetical protein ABIA26_000176 [Sinorhizobium fredii]
MPDLPGGSSALPTLIPDHLRDDRRPVIRYDDYLHAVAQHEICNLGFAKGALVGRHC